RAEDRGARRGKLDRQRYAIQSSADGANRLEFFALGQKLSGRCLYSGHAELHRAMLKQRIRCLRLCGWPIKRKHMENMLARDAQHLPARGDDGNVRTHSNKGLDELRDRVDEVLTAIEQQ